MTDFWGDEFCSFYWEKLLNLFFICLFFHEFWCFYLDVKPFGLKLLNSNSLSSTFRKVWRHCKAMAAAGANFLLLTKTPTGLEQKHIRGNHPHWYIDPGSFGAQRGAAKRPKKKRWCRNTRIAVSPWKINGWNLKMVAWFRWLSFPIGWFW